MYQPGYILASLPNGIPNNQCYILSFTPINVNNDNFITIVPSKPKKYNKVEHPSIKLGRKSTGKHQTAAGIHFANRLRGFCGRELTHIELNNMIKQMRKIEKYSHIPSLNRDCIRSKVAFYAVYQQYEKEIFQAISKGEVKIQPFSQN